MTARLPLMLSIILLAVPAGAQAQRASSTSSSEFFEKKVRPVLARNCYKCHSATSQKLKGHLKLDSREGMLRGGDDGAVIIPGNPGRSMLIQAVRGADPDKQMPPKSKLNPQAIADLEQWVKMGAPWPGAPGGTGHPAVPLAAATGPHNLADVSYETLRRQHWAWQPIQSVTPPRAASAWPETDIDRFVMATLSAKGLHPVADADRVTLIRRLSFDLTGLPPTPREINDFVKDASSTAYEKVVDRMLASPAFGERWGRHWLDVARYAESTGSARNVPYPQAWRYRDYVIDAFNKDKPYNQFITEQIAGDLLPAKNSAERDEHLIATGFLAIGVKDLNERDRLKFQMDNIDEQIDVMSRSILGLTVSCARCHDHKFDPIPTRDYYSLAGIFKSTEILAGVTAKRGAKKNYANSDLLIALTSNSPPGEAVTHDSMVNAARIAALTEKLDQARADLRTLLTRIGGIANLKSTTGAVRRALRQKRNVIQAIEAELQTARGGSKPGTIVAGDLAMGVRDEPTPSDARICIHGDTDNLGPDVPRGLISVIHFPGEPLVSRTRSGRLELAHWLTSPQNPLTSRVMVNRVWEHLFGQGLVRTADNFGTTGDPPTNPQLLDYLAGQFIKDGWSVKKIVRQVVLSRAYRLASTYDPDNAHKDPGNEFIWRMSPHRLEAECIRDAMLAAAGRIELDHPTGSPVMNLSAGELRKFAGAGRMAQEDDHRSVYLPVIREMVPQALSVFDFAEPTMVIADREVTTVPTQALYLLNDPFVVEQSKAIAQRVLAQTQMSDAQRINYAYGLTVGRSATPAERQRVLRYVNGDSKPSGEAAAKTRLDAWAGFCQALLCSAEFRYVD